MPAPKMPQYPALPRYEDAVRTAPNARTPLLPKPSRTSLRPAHHIESSSSSYQRPTSLAILSHFLKHALILAFTYTRIVFFAAIPVSIYFALLPEYYIFALFPIALIGRLADVCLPWERRWDLPASSTTLDYLFNALGRAAGDFVDAMAWVLGFLVLRFAVYCVLALGWLIVPTVWVVLKAVGEAVGEAAMALWRAIGEPVWEGLKHPGDLFESVLHWGIWKF